MHREGVPKNKDGVHNKNKDGQNKKQDGSRNKNQDGSHNKIQDVQNKKTRWRPQLKSRWRPQQKSRWPKQKTRWPRHSCYVQIVMVAILAFEPSCVHPRISLSPLLGSAGSSREERTRDCHFHFPQSPNRPFNDHIY